MEMLRSDYELFNVEVENFNLTRLLPWNYKEIRKDLIAKDADIPCWSELKDRHFLWVTTEDMSMTIRIDCTASGRSYYDITVKIKAGYITDLASIPRMARFLITRNDESIIIGSFFHDICFGTRSFSFEVSNYLFKQINDFYGMGFFTSNIVYLAVKTPFARSHYQRDTEEITEALKKVQITYLWK